MNNEGQSKIDPKKRKKMLHQCNKLLDKGLVLPEHIPHVLHFKEALETKAKTVDSTAYILFIASKEELRGCHLRGPMGCNSLKARERRRIKEEEEE